MSRQSHGRFHFLGYLDLGRVKPCIQRCEATEARARPCSTDVLQHDFIAGQGFAGPIGADQIEHVVLDRVPFGCACGIMSDRDCQSEFIGQVLQTDLPGPATITIGTSAVGFDRQPRHLRIPTPSDFQPPRTDGTHRKRCRLMSSANHDIARVAIFVKDAVRIGSAPCQCRKVVVQYVASLTAPTATAVFEVTDQFLFLRVHADYRPTLPLELSPPPPQQAELAVTVWIFRPTC